MRTLLCILLALSGAAPAAAQDKSATVKWLERAQRAGMVDEAEVEDVRLEELLQKQKHHELISELGPQLERGGVLPASRLYMLARAYSEIRDHAETLATADAMQARIRAGDDVVGFTRGLLYAGARTILSSLWKVDDLATRDLMVDFYGRLPQTDKDEALRQAQLKVKKTYPHPYCWAAFQLTGRAR